MADELGVIVQALADESASAGKKYLDAVQRSINKAGGKLKVISPLVDTKLSEKEQEKLSKKILINNTITAAKAAANVSKIRVEAKAKTEAAIAKLEATSNARSEMATKKLLERQVAQQKSAADKIYQYSKTTMQNAQTTLSKGQNAKINTDNLGMNIGQFAGAVNAYNPSDKNSVKALIDAQNKLKISRSEVQSVLSNTSAEQRNATAVNNITRQIEAYLKVNGKIKAKDKELYAGMTSIATRVSSGEMSPQQAAEEFSRARVQAREAGLEAKTFGQSIKEAFGRYAAIGFATTGLLMIKQTIKKMVTAVKELDASIVSLQIATGMTFSQAEALLGTYTKLGKEIGATTVQVASAADAFLRQGKSVEDTNILVKDSLMLSKLGQIDSAQSTQYLTSAMKGYKVEVKDTIGIVDKLTAVDMEAAVSAGGIAEAMSMTANGARLAGVSMDKLIGIMTTVGEVSQQDMSRVGTTFKTVFARMSNVKLNILEDEDGNDISGELNNVEQTLGRIGITLRKSPTEWNNFGSVLDQLSVKWKELSSVDQSAIAMALGGVRQKEAILTMMENYDKVLQYEKTAMESSGTALEKFNNAYLGSMEAKTNAFKASFESFSMSIINSNVLKTITDIGSATLSWLDGTDRWIPTLGRVLGVATAIGIVLKRNQIAMTLGKFREIGVALAPATKELSTVGYIAKGAGASLKAFFSTPLGAATLIAGAIFLISSGIKALDKTTAEAMDKFAKESSKYEENKTSLEGVNSELKTTKNRISEINAIPLKTLAEQDELDNLEEKNKKLQIQYDLLLAQSKLLESNKAQAGAEVYSSLNKGNVGYGFGFTPSGYSQSGKRLSDLSYFEKLTSPMFSTGGADALPMALEGYKSSQKEMELIVDKESSRYKKLKKDLSDYSSSIQEISAAYQAVLESYVKGTPQYIEAEKVLSAVSVTLGTATTKSEKYSEVMSKYSSAKTELEELSAANKLNVESVSELVSKYPALKSELDSIGVSVEQLVTEFATASDPIAEMNQSIADLKTTMDGLPERMLDLEAINKKVSDGYHFSITEIDEILKKYPQLESAVTRTAHGFQIASGAIDTLSTGVSFTTGEIEQLEKVHGTLKYTVDETTGLVYIEKTSLDSLGASATQLKINLVRAQIEMNQAAILGATSRIKAIEAEISAISKLDQAKLSSYQIAKNERDELRAEKSRNSLISQNTVGQANLDNLISQLDSYQSELDRIGTGSVSGYTPEKPKEKPKAKTAEELLEEEKKLQKDAFEAQKAIIDRQLALNLITEEQYTNSLEALYKQFYSDKSKYLAEYTQYEIEVYNKRQSFLEQAQKDLESLHKATMDMIKKEKEEEKDALEKKKDGLKEYTDARKKALQDARDQDSYDKQIREKSTDIESIKAQLMGLSGDMSGAGMRKKTELTQRLKEAQDELSEAVADRQYEMQVEALDASYEAQEKNIDAQIEGIDSFLNNQNTLVKASFDRMNGMSATLKSQLIAYNKEYGDGIANDIVKNWDAATEALKKYGSAANVETTLGVITTNIGRASSQVPTGYANGTSGLKRDSIIVGTHELLLNKTGSNAYQMMNAGSPIFTEQQTNALKALLSSPNSLLTKTVGGVGLKNASTIMSMVNSNNSPSIEINYEMNISGTDPQGIKLALAKEMPKFSDYVLNKINKDVQFNKGVRLTAANMT